MPAVKGLTIAAAVKTLTAPKAAILLKPHVRGFGGAVAFSAAVFASTVVGAGSIPAAGATPPSPPPGAGGAPGFSEQLQQATAQAGNTGSVEATPAAILSAIHASLQKVPATLPADWDIQQLPRATAQAGSSGSVEETPKATHAALKGSSQSLPATAAAGVPFNIAKPRGKADWDVVEQLPRATAEAGSSGPGTTTPAAAPESATVIAKPAIRGKVDGNDKFSPSQPDIPASSAKPVEAAVIAPKDLVTASGSVPVVTRGTWRRPAPDGRSSEAVADPPSPANGLPSDRNTDLRNSIPAQVPAFSNPTQIVSQPSSVLLQTEGSVTATLPIRTDAAFNPNIRELAFAARIEPGGATGQPQDHPVSAATPIASSEPASQSVKAIGQASTRDGDSGYDQRENSAPPTSNAVSSSVSPAAKPSFRKEETADNAANAVEPNAAPPTQPVPPSVSTVAPAEAGLTAKPASAAPGEPSVATPEPTHVLLDKPSQTTSPARNISLQVEGASGQTVDIRIAARSGDLNVAVRAGDENVAQNLRQGLDDLESHLAQNGYHAETWHPGHSGSNTEPAAPASSSSNSSSQQQSQSQAGPGSQQNRGQRDNNPSNRPRWVNELASTLKAQSPEKGNENGIGT